MMQQPMKTHINAKTACIVALAGAIAATETGVQLASLSADGFRIQKQGGDEKGGVSGVLDDIHADIHDLWQHDWRNTEVVPDLYWKTQHHTNIPSTERERNMWNQSWAVTEMYYRLRTADYVMDGIIPKPVEEGESKLEEALKKKGDKTKQEWKDDSVVKGVRERVDNITARLESELQTQNRLMGMSKTRAQVAFHILEGYDELTFALVCGPDSGLADSARSLFEDFCRIKNQQLKKRREEAQEAARTHQQTETIENQNANEKAEEAEVNNSNKQQSSCWSRWCVFQ